MDTEPRRLTANQIIKLTPIIMRIEGKKGLIRQPNSSAYINVKPCRNKSV